MKNDFNLKKKINVIGNKIFTNFEQKLHNFRLNHPLQDLWILMNTGVVLYHREFDNTISDQLFGGLMSALNEITENLVEGSISSFGTTNMQFNILKNQDLLFVSNSSIKHKEKEVIKALEIVSEKFTKKFDATFFETWNLDVSVFANFKEEIMDQLEEKPSILKNQDEKIEKKPNIYNLRHKPLNFKQKLNKDNFQKIKKTRSFKILTYGLVQAAIIGVILGTQLAIYNMTGNLRGSADFDANESIIIEGGFVQFIFNGSDEDGPLEFIWDFGDGSPLSSDRNPTHQYVTSGNYTVSLTVIDINGVIDSIEKEAFITVIDDLLPQADFYGDTTSVISGEFVQFIFNGSAGNEPTDFVWNFGDGSPLVSERNPRHRYDALGIHDVSLIVFDADDDVDFENKFDYITVIEDLSPQADFENNISTILQGDSIQFTFNGTEGNYPTTLSWDFGDGSTSIERNPVHNFNTPGIFNVSLKVSDVDGDIDIIERVDLIKVIENLFPEANFIVNESIIIQGESVKFLFTGNEGNSPTLYTWDFGDGLISNEKNPSHQYDSPGNYNVSLTIIDSDNQNDMLIKVGFISVLNDLDPDADFEANITSIIEGQFVQFLFEGDEGNDPAIFFWNFGDGQTSAEKEPIHQYNTFGYYNVSLTVIDHNGDIDVKKKNNFISVIKDLFPVADFSANTTELLEGDSVKFTYNGSQGNDIVSFNWDFGDGFTSINEDPIHTFNTIGTYDVTLTVCDIDGDIDSEIKIDFILISGDIIPTANFNVNITSIIEGEYIKFSFDGNEGNGPTTYIWNFGDGSTSSEMNPMYKYQTSGTFNISLMVTDNDGDVAFEEKLNFITVIADLTPEADFKINVTTFLEGEFIQFTFNGTEGNNPMNFEWNFGDGSTSTDMNPIHQYDTPGIYNISLRIVDLNGDIDFENKINYITVIEDLIPIADFETNTTSIFEGEFIQFIFNGTEGNNPMNFEWNFGDGSTSTDMNPIHQYDTPGIYIISLRIVDLNGDIDFENKINYITVIEDLIPIADFETNTTSIFEGEFIQFTFNGTEGNNPMNFEWNFGDGSTSTDMNPIHQYDTPGIYNISLKIVDLNGDIDFENKINYITVIEDLIPIADFETNTTSIFEGEFIQFTFNGTEGNNPMNFEWNFGDGSTSTDMNPIHQYDTPGIYNISLRIVDLNGDIDFENKINYITVIEDLIPIADFETNTTSIFEGEFIQFTFNGTEGNNPMTFEWDFGDGSTSTDMNPIHQYNTPGIYNISLLIVDLNSDIDSENKINYITVIEDLIPIANFETNTTSIFEGEFIQFTFNGTEGNNPMNFEWNFGDGFVSTDMNPIHQYVTPGLFNVSLKITDLNGDIDFEEKKNFIIINIDLNPNSDFGVNATRIFEGDFIQFTFNGTEGNNPATFEWDFGDGSISNDRNPIYQYNTSGIYNISLKIIDIDGDIDIHMEVGFISVLQDIQPIIDFYSNETTIITGQSVQFTFTGISGNDPAIFIWNFGDGSTSTDMNPIHQYDTPGIYNISLRIVDLNGDIDFENKINYITVIEDLIPIADFETNTTSIFEGEFIQFTFNGTEGNNPMTFEWYFGDGSTSTDMNPIHQYNIPGNFSASLKIIDSNGDISVETKYNLIEVIEDLEPIADYHANKTKVVLGEEIYFKFNGTEGNGPMTYYWDFGDGFTSTEKNPMHQYFETGKYNVSLTITDSDGDVSIEFKEEYIVVNYKKLPYYDLIMFLLAILCCIILVMYIIHKNYDKFKFGHRHAKYKRKRRREKRRREKKKRRKHRKDKKKKKKKRKR